MLCNAWDLYVQYYECSSTDNKYYTGKYIKKYGEIIFQKVVNVL